MYDLVAIYSSKMKKHEMGHNHPESPMRLIQVLKGYNIFSKNANYACNLISAEKADINTIRNVHDIGLINTVKSISLQGGGMISWDNVLNKFTYESALYAAGAAVQSVKVINEGKTKKSFAIVRPPGHHTNGTTVAGFCFFNNMAIGTEWAVNHTRYKKIAIIDIDHHFGNGTSNIFYYRKDVLYFSIHAHPSYSYPGSGYPFEIGSGDGMGYNVNIPVLPNTNTRNWLFAFYNFLPIIEQFNPDLILVSLGFDALKTDPVGMLNLSSVAFQAAGYLIHNLADKLTNGKVATILEGGYDLKKLPECTINYLRGIMGEEPKLLATIDNWGVNNANTPVLKELKKNISSFWDVGGIK